MARETISTAGVVVEDVVVDIVNSLPVMMIPECDVCEPNHEVVVVVEFQMAESSCVAMTLMGVVEDGAVT